MKKLLLISVLVCFVGLSQLFAINPIPSYNVKVIGKASFQELGKPFISVNNIITKEKRQLNVETTISSGGGKSGLSNSIVAISVYRLDGQITMGPYFLICGQSLTVGIDDQPWGVNLIAQDLSIISVWTSTDQPAN